MKDTPHSTRERDRGLSLRKASTETFSLSTVHAKKLHKVPMTFHQRLLPNWQNRCDTSRLQLIRRITGTSKLSAFSAAKHSSPAAAPGVPERTLLRQNQPPLLPRRWHCRSVLCRHEPGTLGASQLPVDRAQGFETRRRDSEGLLYLHPSAGGCPSQNAGGLSSSCSHNGGSRPLFVPQI